MTAVLNAAFWFALAVAYAPLLTAAAVLLAAVLAVRAATT
jgi:hypothetical protein